jgi:DNA-binding LacI/PurR family transcriptional regulator
MPYLALGSELALTNTRGGEYAPTFGPGHPMSRPTIRDVAEVAGVSVSTVSRVLSHPELFRESTRQRVQEAATSLNYSPSRHAASLSTGKTANIGLITPSLSNPVFAEMVKAGQHRADDAGFAVLLGDSDDDAGREQKLIHALAKDVDGIIDFSSLLPADQLPAAAALRPMVFVNRAVTGQRCVLVNSLQGMRLIMHYLANLGHDSVYYLPGPEYSWVAADRESAAAIAADEAGVQFELGAAGGPGFEAGVGHADRLMGGRLPTAILCFNDVMALGVLSRLLAVGVRVPERVSVCGWGGTRFAGYYTPPLTTISMPLQDLGRIAVEQLLLRPVPPSPNDPGPHLLLDVTLDARATTGRAAVR